MNDFHKLSSKLTLFAKDLQNPTNSQASKIASSCAILILRELAYRTPVDTSKAISNWRITLGRRAKNATLDPHIVGKAGSSKFESAEITISKGIVKLKDKKAGQKIYISNTLDYIDDLDYGKSMQNSQFVKQSIEVALFKVKRLKQNPNDSRKLAVV